MGDRDNFLSHTPCWVSRGIIPLCARTAVRLWLLDGSDYSEDALIEQPAIALFGELGWETADCFHEFEQPGGSPLGRETAAEVVLVRRLRRGAGEAEPESSCRGHRAGHRRDRARPQPDAPGGGEPGDLSAAEGGGEGKGPREAQPKRRWGAEAQRRGGEGEIGRQGDKRKRLTRRSGSLIGMRRATTTSSWRRNSG